MSFAYEKQFLVNFIHLPYDMREAVKSYCFIDSKTSEKIKKYKIEKKKLFEEDFAKLSFTSDDDKKDGVWETLYWKQEQWTESEIEHNEEEYDYYFDEPDPYVFCGFAASNCIQCGDYKQINSDNMEFEQLPERIKCKCI